MIELNDKQKQIIITHCDWENENKENAKLLMKYFSYIQKDYSDPDYAFTLYYDDKNGDPIELEHFGNIDFIYA